MKEVKNNNDLEKFIRWILMVQSNIETYNRIILESDGKSISEFEILYRESTDSYFLSILRNLIDNDSRVTSIVTFSEQFFIDEFNILLWKLKWKNYSNADSDLLQKFCDTLKQIRERKKELYKKYNKWMNEYNSHLNTERLNEIIVYKRDIKWTTIQYKKPPTKEITQEISNLLDLFQKIIVFMSNDSQYTSHIFNSKIDHLTKIQLTETEIQ